MKIDNDLSIIEKMIYLLKCTTALIVTFNRITDFSIFVQKIKEEIFLNLMFFFIRRKYGKKY